MGDNRLNVLVSRNNLPTNRWGYHGRIGEDWEDTKSLEITSPPIGGDTPCFSVFARKALLKSTKTVKFYRALKSVFVGNELKNA